MANFRSPYIRAIGWEIETDASAGSGTDSRVTVQIIRDDMPLIALNVEPGETVRLDRGNKVFHFWEFHGAYFVPSEFTTWIAGLPYPNGVEFPDDVTGHLRCRFEISGDDLWRKDRIDGYVRYTRYQHIPGTIDSFEWVDDEDWTHVGTFARDVNLSTDMAEGVTRLTLIY